ncbi:hypothetical protein Ciccas_002681 [Cichlidogyrus casuarinus]|uniref:Uncharacterized protein n=1 Tax=Cichlidogyrus casuarinus TaxID=1844966 RepID=A0ABD2QGK6_9PLAT
MHLLIFGLTDYFFDNLEVRCVDPTTFHQISWIAKIHAKNETCGKTWTAKGFAEFTFIEIERRNMLLIRFSVSKCHSCDTPSIASWYTSILIWLFGKIAEHPSASRFRRHSPVVEERAFVPSAKAAFSRRLSKDLEPQTSPQDEVRVVG